MDLQRPVSSGSKARLPDFIAVGPPRTASTWLDRVLTGRIGLPRGTKSTSFFTDNYSRGLDWYLSHFQGYGDEIPVGEFCPIYFASAQARERIVRHIPRCKIICTLRDPVQWLYSHYKVWRRHGRIKVGFEEALSKHFDLLMAPTRFAFYTATWQATFGKENVLVLVHDDLEADPQNYMDSVCAFLRISPFRVAESPAARQGLNVITQAPRSRRLAQNAFHFMEWLTARRLYGVVRLLDRFGLWEYCFSGGEAYQPMAPATEARLREMFRPEVYALECLLDRDLSPWKQPRAPRKTIEADRINMRDWQSARA